MSQPQNINTTVNSEDKVIFVTTFSETQWKEWVSFVERSADMAEKAALERWRTMLHNESKKEKYEVDEQWTRFGPQDSPIWKTVLKVTRQGRTLQAEGFARQKQKSRDLAAMKLMEES